MTRCTRIVLSGLLVVALVLGEMPRHASAADLSGVAVKEAIERGKKFLASQQEASGAWSNGTEGQTVGTTAIALLALINSGMTSQDGPVKRGLKFLRESDPSVHPETYQVALSIMALAAAKDGATDRVRISHLAQRLEAGQVTQTNPGAWGYELSGGGGFIGGDSSNTQFAILGLREAVEAGAVVSRETWTRNRDYWVRGQNGLYQSERRGRQLRQHDRGGGLLVGDLRTDAAFRSRSRAGWNASLLQSSRAKPRT